MRILVALQAPLNSKLFTKYNFFGGITSVDVPAAPHVWFHARKNAYIHSIQNIKILWRSHKSLSF